MPLTVKQSDVDVAVRRYLHKTGIAATWFDRCRDTDRERLRQEIVTLVTLATSQNVSIDRGV